MARSLADVYNIYAEEATKEIEALAAEERELEALGTEILKRTILFSKEDFNEFIKNISEGTNVQLQSSYAFDGDSVIMYDLNKIASYTRNNNSSSLNKFSMRQRTEKGLYFLNYFPNGSGDANEIFFIPNDLLIEKARENGFFDVEQYIAELLTMRKNGAFDLKIAKSIAADVTEQDMPRLVNRVYTEGLPTVFKNVNHIFNLQAIQSEKGEDRAFLKQTEKMVAPSTPVSIAEVGSKFTAQTNDTNDLKLAGMIGDLHRLTTFLESGSFNKELLTAYPSLFTFSFDKFMERYNKINEIFSGIGGQAADSEDNQSFGFDQTIRRQR